MNGKNIIQSINTEHNGAPETTTRHKAGLSPRQPVFNQKAKDTTIYFQNGGGKYILTKY